VVLCAAGRVIGDEPDIKIIAHQAVKCCAFRSNGNLQQRGKQFISYSEKTVNFEIRKMILDRHAKE